MPQNGDDGREMNPPSYTALHAIMYIIGYFNKFENAAKTRTKATRMFFFVFCNFLNFVFGVLRTNLFEFYFSGEQGQ